MGGLNAFIISENLGRPALVFNPPLQKHIPVNFQNHHTKGPAPKTIILGRKDVVIDPNETLIFLSQYSQEAEIIIKLFPYLEHRIPLELFNDALIKYDSNAALFFMGAKILMKLDDLDQANKHYIKAIGLDPKNEKYRDAQQQLLELKNSLTAARKKNINLE